MSTHTVPVAIKSTTYLSRVLMGFVLFAIIGSQAAFAQQGSECLACHTGLPATFGNLIPEESSSEPVVSAACDYSSADLFNGWGWNPIVQESCPPLTDAPQLASSCDYSTSDNFNGWGWDPIARESCPPIEDQDPHAAFPVCSATLYDVDGDGFGWENEASCIITSASELAPVFINDQTGNQVDLVRANWNANNDLANRIIQCDLYYYDSYSRQYLLEPVPFRAGASLNNQVFPSYRFHHLSLPTVAPFIGLIDTVAYVDGSTITPTLFGSDANWTTNDGRYIGPTVLQSPYVELISLANGTRAIRTWHESRFDTALNLAFSGNRVQRDGFFECRDVSGSDLTPTRGMATTDTGATGSSNRCDYSNADASNGWGWNPVTRESCAPQTDTVANTDQACDYSNAGTQNGWGWNQSTGQSCPPR